MNGSGSIGLGYSVTASTMYPDLRYVGRTADDPLGTMPLGEEILVSGTGPQYGGGSRWGDYAAMSVDPVDDQTFWFTSE